MAHPLNRLVQGLLNQTEPEVLIELSLLLWYSPDPMPELLEVIDGLQGIELRRALYVIDRLRRYGTALTRQRYQELSDLVRSWGHLKVIFVPPPPYPRGPLAVDRNALGWGLVGESLNTKAILPYQTRHYVASVRKV